MPPKGKNDYARLASRTSALLVSLSLCGQLAAYSQPANIDGGNTQSVRVGALFTPAEAAGQKHHGVGGMWQAFFHQLSHRAKKEKKHKAPKTASKKTSKKLSWHHTKAAHKQTAHAASTGSIKFAGGTLRSSPDAKLSVQHRTALKLEQGELLIAARQNVSVHCAQATVTIRKGTIAFVSVEGSTLKVRNLDESRYDSVRVSAPGKVFGLYEGQELAIGKTYSDLYTSLSNDQVLRRQLKNYRLSTDEIVNTCEFAAVSFIKHNGVLTAMYHSTNREDRRIFNKVMKATACLTVVTAAHGWYLPVHPPSQEQTALATALQQKH